MLYSQKQSQQSFNRKALSDLYAHKATCKLMRANVHYPEHIRNHAHKCVLSATRTIAKLESLQRALKQDMSKDIAFQRACRTIELMRASVLNNVGQCYE